MYRKSILVGFVMLTIAAGPSLAHAATAVCVTQLNLRAGPGAQYPVVAVLPPNSYVTTYGCLADYSSCDVSWGAERGWVSASYIRVLQGGQPVVVTASSAPTMGIAVVAFDYAYWQRYYVGRPWFATWSAYTPPHAVVVTGVPAPVVAEGVTACGPNGCGHVGATYVPAQVAAVRGVAVAGGTINRERAFGQLTGVRGLARGGFRGGRTVAGENGAAHVGSAGVAGPNGAAGRTGNTTVGGDGSVQHQGNSGWVGVNGGSGRGSNSYTRNADGSASGNYQNSGRTAGGASYNNSGSAMRDANGALTGNSQSSGSGDRGSYEVNRSAANGTASRNTNVTSAATGDTYQGQTTYTKGQGVSHAGTCKDASGNPIPC